MTRLASVLTVAALALGLATTATLAEGRWQQVENQPGCDVWNANPQESETVTWVGDCVDGKTDGIGKLVWRYFDNGDWKEGTYTGERREGKANGHGVQVQNDKRYEGDWKKGKRHGHGVYVWADGVKYEGEWNNNKQHGHGVQVWKSGTRYEGGWEYGLYHGYGVKTWGADSKYAGQKYEGEWNYNKKHGNGVFVWKNGSQFEGKFENNLPNGDGTYIPKFGSNFTGFWIDGCHETDWGTWLNVMTSLESCG